MLIIDGSQGEGGGQILRSSLALSMITQKPFRIFGIRAGRRKPGLLRQHLTAVNAALEISLGKARGNVLGSLDVTFNPSTIKHGDYRFNIGSAGSTTLVLQTILPALLMAPGPSCVILEGGTHNLAAPPVDFLDQAFLPILRRMGAGVELHLEQHGFYPAGGGRLRVEISPVSSWNRIDFSQRGELKRLHAKAVVSKLPRRIAVEELKTIEDGFHPLKIETSIEEVESSPGPGNVLMVTVESEDIVELFTGFGRKGLPAKKVAMMTFEKVNAYLESGVPVGSHLADQLLIPMAQSGGGSFRTTLPTSHLTTNIEVIRTFLGIPIDIICVEDQVFDVSIGAL